MRNMTKGARIAVTAGAATVLIGGAAFAYWTAGGSGTGSASTGTVQPITAVQTSTVSAMGPGIAPQTLSGTFSNPNESPVYVTSVTASIASVVKATGAPAGTCDATDFTLSGATMSVGAEAAVNDTTTWTGATLAFNNKADVNQDACKGATVNLAYAVS